MITSPNLGLLIWNLGSDPYNHEELAENWAKVDQHDHTPGRGSQIGTAAIVDAAVTASKIAPGVVTELSLSAGQVTNDKIANDAVDGDKILDGSVTINELAPGLALPIGALINWPGSSAPTGWLLCDGSVVSQGVYSDLYTLVGTTYDTGGEGAGKFRLPDFRGRMAVGKSSTLTVGTSDGVAEASRTPLHSHSDGSLGVASHTHGLGNHHHRHIFPIISNGSNKQVVGPEDSFPDAAGSTVDPLDTFGPATQSRSVDITGQTASTTLSRQVVTSSTPVDGAGTAANTSDATSPDVTGATGTSTGSYLIVNFIIKAA
jgi:microcystin-dependent protein